MAAVTKRFHRRIDAENWLNVTSGDIVRGAWIDPRAGQVTPRSFANDWLEQRPDLRPTTRGKYRHLLDRHILPALGDTPLSKLSPTRVRSWHADLRRRHPATAAGAYRLLATICNTAVRDVVIARSPCKVKGGADEASKERPTATVAEVTAAVETCPEQYRLAILLAAWCQLRRGEVLGLQRRDIDELHATVKIARTWLQISNGSAQEGLPKTKAGHRIVNIPPNVVAVLRDHLDRFTGPSPDSWLFPGEGDNPASPRTLDRAWDTARRATGRDDLRFHDLSSRATCAALPMREKVVRPTSDVGRSLVPRAESGLTLEPRAHLIVAVSTNPRLPCKRLLRSARTPTRWRGGAMDVVVERCAGFDVHKDTVVACVRMPDPSGAR